MPSKEMGLLQALDLCTMVTSAYILMILIGLKAVRLGCLASLMAKVGLVGVMAMTTLLLESVLFHGIIAWSDGVSLSEAKMAPPGIGLTLLSFFPNFLLSFLFIALLDRARIGSSIAIWLRKQEIALWELGLDYGSFMKAKFCGKPCSTWLLIMKEVVRWLTVIVSIVAATYVIGIELIMSHVSMIVPWALLAFAGLIVCILLLALLVERFGRGSAAK